jgi:hypothetical protein
VLGSLDCACGVYSFASLFFYLVVFVGFSYHFCVVCLWL